MMRDIKLNTIIKAGVYLEEGEYFLEVEGRAPGGTVVIPRIAIGSLICIRDTESLFHNNGMIKFAEKVSVNMKVLAGEDKSYVQFQADEKPPKEMTIAEIQKELGYKIKIKE